MKVKTIGDVQYYQVSKVPLVKAMVLNGSLLPEEEIAKSIHSWNLKPITFAHPSENGRQVSAALETQIPHHIGFVNNARMDKSRMFSDLLLHKEKIDHMPDGQRLKNHIEAGNPINVSTAYFDYGSVSTNGVDDGREYTSITKNIAPDHLAILLDEPGSCSVKDGCGINVNQKKDSEMATDKKDDDIKTNAEIAAAAADVLGEFMQKNDETLKANAKGMEDMSANLKTCMDGIKELGDRMAKLEAKKMKANEDDTAGDADADDTDTEDFETMNKKKKTEKDAKDDKKDDGKKPKTNMKTHDVDYDEKDLKTNSDRTPSVTSWDEIFNKQAKE